MCEVCRRSFIRGAAALGAAGATGLFSSSLMAQERLTGSSRLPPRGEFTIANAHVMTMDGALGDIAGGAVHVRNGEIIAVGTPETIAASERSYTGRYLQPRLRRDEARRAVGE